MVKLILVKAIDLMCTFWLVLTDYMCPCNHHHNQNIESFLFISNTPEIFFIFSCISPIPKDNYKFCLVQTLHKSSICICRLSFHIMHFICLLKSLFILIEIKFSDSEYTDIKCIIQLIFWQMLNPSSQSKIGNKQSLQNWSRCNLRQLVFWPSPKEIFFLISCRLLLPHLKLHISRIV